MILSVASSLSPYRPSSHPQISSSSPPSPTPVGFAVRYAIVSYFQPYPLSSSAVAPPQVLRRFRCRAKLPGDVPYVAAIGSCILSSLVFPIPRASDDAEGRMVDTRLGIMTVISIIPYFNWLSWTFAWLDSGKSRYLIYSLVYLAPYFRKNFVLSSDESWLPIATILLCIIHIQLEISIRNGDIDGFPLSLVFKNMFKESQQQVHRTHKKVSKKDSVSKKSNGSLPSVKDEQREQLRDWEIPQKNKVDQVNWGENAEEERKQ